MDGWIKVYKGRRIDQIASISITEAIIFAILTGLITNLLGSIVELIDNGVSVGLIIVWIFSLGIILGCLGWTVWVTITDRYYKPVSELITELVTFSILTGVITNLIGNVDDLIANGITLGLATVWVLSVMIIIGCLGWLSWKLYRKETTISFAPPF